MNALKLVEKLEDELQYAEVRIQHISESCGVIEEKIKKVFYDGTNIIIETEDI